MSLPSSVPLLRCFSKALSFCMAIGFLFLGLINYNAFRTVPDKQMDNVKFVDSANGNPASSSHNWNDAMIQPQKQISSDSSVPQEQHQVLFQAEGIVRERGIAGSLDTKPFFGRNKPHLEHNMGQFIVIPENKLLFCIIPKVGSRMFESLFRLLRLLRPELSPREARSQANRVYRSNSIMHFGLSTPDVEAIMADPHWTKAVFFREPAARFLSGFQSKCLRVDRAGAYHCRHAFGIEVSRLAVKDPLLAFEKAVLQLQGGTIGNFHFRPMHQFCGGLDHSLEYYDFIHQLVHRTAPTHVERLLTGVGVNESLAHGLATIVVESEGVRLLEFDEAVKALHPNVNLRTRVDANYTTGAPGTLEHYYRKPGLLEIVQQYYAKDYELFELPKMRVVDVAAWLA